MPGADGLTPDLQEFVYRYVSSRPALDVLMLVRSDPAGAWTAERVAERVPGLAPERAGDLLVGFHWHGFLVPGTHLSFTYRPATEDLARLADRLAKVYAETPVAVLAEIARLEILSSVRSLADAFRLRKA